MNIVSYNLCLQTFVDDSNVYMEGLINMHEKKTENKYTDPVQKEDGQVIIDKQKWKLLKWKNLPKYWHR